MLCYMKKFFALFACIISFGVYASQQGEWEKEARQEVLKFIQTGNPVEVAEAIPRVNIGTLKDFDLEMMQAILERKLAPKEQLAQILSFQKGWEDSAEMEKDLREAFVHLYKQVGDINELNGMKNHILSYCKDVEEMKLLLSLGAKILLDNLPVGQLSPEQIELYKEKRQRLLFPDEVYKNTLDCPHCNKKLLDGVVECCFDGKEKMKYHITCAAALWQERSKE